jgi:hypothetical protein
VVVRILSVFRLLCLSAFLVIYFGCSASQVSVSGQTHGHGRQSDPLQAWVWPDPRPAWFFCGSVGSVDFRVFFVFFHFDLLCMFSFWFFAIFLK